MNDKLKRMTVILYGIDITNDLVAFTGSVDRPIVYRYAEVYTKILTFKDKPSEIKHNGSTVISVKHSLHPGVITYHKCCLDNKYDNALQFSTFTKEFVQ